MSTRLVGEREIDVDDRQARVLFTLEMLETGLPAIIAHDLHVTVALSDLPPNENIDIAVFGREDQPAEDGRLVVFHRNEHLSLRPGEALTRELMVRTGAFSSPDLSRGPAVPGPKHYDVSIEFQIEPGLGKASSDMVIHVTHD